MSALLRLLFKFLSLVAVVAGFIACTALSTHKSGSALGDFLDAILLAAHGQDYKPLTALLGAIAMSILLSAIGDCFVAKKT